ncbi:MAG: hypothetical protein JEZ05_05865 [Tenericutes bacterium]|nr:hypothetical protein [Mycoplasmatota bacterium]
MNKKKIILSFVLVVFLLAITSVLINAKAISEQVSVSIDTSYEISTDSNFFGQPENEELVSIPDDYLGELLIGGFKLVAETDDLELYIYERNFNVAVYDKASGYLWYSVYPEYRQMMLSGTSKYFVESGVVIEYYNLDNILVDDSKSYLSGSKYNVSTTYDYESLEDGVVAHIEFNDLAISFDVNVSIAADKLVVNLPIDTLTEGDIEKQVLNIDGTTDTQLISYRLKSVYIFPYFGSNNYEINGYSFIPDGSGGLIRYTDNRSSTAYVKRIYGQDEGVLKYSTKDSTYYLQDELTASMPVFGVNHGYKQAAFLSVITEGDAYAEIHSYPYGYNSYLMNTTFAKFIVRERYSIQTSTNEGDSFQMINELPYQTDFTVEYHFLSNEEASYSGMALKFRELLELEKQELKTAINLFILGMDYKNGLFGKNYIEMTQYLDVIDIVAQLSSSNLTDLNLVYFAWNRGGFYDNQTDSPKIANILGGKKDFSEMLAYLEAHDVDISFYSNPLIAFSSALGSHTIKKITLSNFATNEVRSSLFRTTYFKSPDEIADSLLSYEDFYSKYGMDNFVFDSVGSNLFTYRDNSENVYRNQSIEILEAELSSLEEYSMGLYEPNSYLWKYINAYYDSPIESNKYAYISDSIPFIQLVLSGSVNQYSSYVNYISDYNIFELRLIEYGITPSFLITKESTHLLRYTNSEYIYTSEFDLWKSTIVDVSEDILSALQRVEGAQMLNHRYVREGVAEVVYDNGIKLYVNYTNIDQFVSGGVIKANSYGVILS